MSKSSTVTVREKPVEEVASATSGGLTIHGETFVVQTDQRVELVDLTNRVMEFVRRFNIREGHRQPVVDAHDVLAVHQRVPDGAPDRHPAGSSSRWSRATPSGCTTIRITPTAIA